MAIKRQQIMTALNTRLEAISSESESPIYNTDLGNSIHEWKATPFQDSDLPGLDYRDINDVITEASGSRHRHDLTVQMDILFSGSTAPTTMRQLIQDVMTAINVDPTWGGLALHTYPVSNESIEIEQAGKKIGGVRLNIVIVFITNAWET